MKCEVIKKAPKMIIAFLGYSFLPESLAHLELGEYGLGVLYDYSKLDFDAKKFASILGEQNYLFGFSMGVAVASEFCADFSFQKAVAMSGTPKGIDESEGIPDMLFKASIDSFDFEGFKRLCFLSELKKVKFAFSPNAKAELESLYEHFCAKAFSAKLSWDKAIIAKKDKIFEPQKLKNAFDKEKNCKITEVNAPHFALFNYTSWEQIFEI